MLYLMYIYVCKILDSFLGMSIFVIKVTADGTQVVMLAQAEVLSENKHMQWLFKKAYKMTCGENLTYAYIFKNYSFK